VRPARRSSAEIGRRDRDRSGRRDARRRVAHLAAAAACNAWFDPAFVDVRAGDAFALGVDDASVDIIAQNCLLSTIPAIIAGAAKRAIPIA